MNDDKSKKLILWFTETDKNDFSLVGGKGANLGELTKIGISVPDGFIITVNAYLKLLNRGGLKHKLKISLKNLDIENSSALQQASEEIRTHILASPIPSELKTKIIRGYRELSGGKDTSVAVRHSTTDDNLLKTILNVKGDKNVLKAVQECWASAFSPRSIFYRKSKRLTYTDVGFAIVIQKMVKPESSGVMFTMEPLSGDLNKISIEAVFGEGRGLVHGSFTPDNYILNKKSLKIEGKTITKQPFQFTAKGKIPVSKAWQKKQKLEDNHIKELAKWGKKIESHYQEPQDIEWVFSNGNLNIVQTRTVKTVKTKEPHYEEQSSRFQELKEKAILEGLGVSPGTGAGPVKKIKSANELSRIKEGNILVAETISPDFVPAMKRAAAIVTEKGGKTSHAAIISRELGIPCVVGAENATGILEDGQLITVVADKSAKIYAGEIKRNDQHPTEDPKKETKSAKKYPPVKTATNIYVNLGQLESVEKIAQKDVDGVGLLRAEFMFAQIGKHPRALIDQGKSNQLEKTITDNVSKIAQEFKPRPVVYRTSDLKTNEYRNLEGGENYEEKERNPMLGFRGASRYVEDPELFKVELNAIKKARQKNRNIWVMIPFVRTPKELIKVKKIMSNMGLHRDSSFQLWLMAEIPSNILILEKFTEVGIDGISIGSNDLTQLTLGVDRDNPKLANLFDERNEAVQGLIKKAIQKGTQHGITVSICGQAPTLYPKLLKNLVKWGITSVSVSPDAIEKTRKIVHETEKEVVSI